MRLVVLGHARISRTINWSTLIEEGACCELKESVSITPVPASLWFNPICATLRRHATSTQKGSLD